MSIATASIAQSQHNHSHAARRRKKRSREQKRRDVIGLLLDPKHAERSDHFLASIADVSQPYVGRLRKELSKNILSLRSAKRVGADGVVRNTARIGKRPRITEAQRQFVLGAIHLGAWTISELLDESGLGRPHLQAILDGFVASGTIVRAPRKAKSRTGGRPELLYIPAPTSRSK